MKIEIDITPQEVQELFTPGEAQTEFMAKAANAYAEAITNASTALFTGGVQNPFENMFTTNSKQKV